MILICLPSYLMKYRVLPTLNLAVSFAGIVFLILWQYKANLKDAGLILVSYLIMSLIVESFAFAYSVLSGMTGYDWTAHPLLDMELAAQMFNFGVKMIFVKAVLKSKEGKISSSVLYFTFWIAVLCLLVSLPAYYLYSIRPYIQAGDFAMIISMALTIILPCTVGASFFFFRKKKSD